MYSSLIFHENSVKVEFTSKFIEASLLRLIDTNYLPKKENIEKIDYAIEATILKISPTVETVPVIRPLTSKIRDTSDPD